MESGDMALLLVAILMLGRAAILHAGPEYDFENSNTVPTEFQATGTSNELTVSSVKHKGGTKSLFWEWQAKVPNAQGPTATLEINLAGRNYDLRIKENELKKGGLKFWMYHDHPATRSTMEIVFHGRLSEETTETTVHLNFKGWRAVWIGYAEFFEGRGTSTPRATCANGQRAFDMKKEGVGMNAISKVTFRITSSNADSLYIDLVRFEAKMNKQTRDMVVKQVSSSQRTAANKFTFYDEKDFWQRSLRWYEHPSTQCAQGDPTQEQLNDILAIEERLKNWYATDDQIRSLTFNQASVGSSNSPSPTRFRDFGAIRWKELYSKNIKTAEKLLTKVLENKPSLFALLSKQGEDDNVTGPKTKFGLVFFKVLLPLAIKYNFKSRQLRQPAEAEGSGDTSRDSGECDDIRDDEDLKNIGELLRHIEDEGWAAGSGLGTLAHEMNKSGAGFIHSMFLLRKILKRRCSALFGRLLKAMKWYTDFNEIYQPNNDYIYDGTTADRMRTILLYRLMVILMETNQNKQVRDTHCYKNWVNHVLRINKGLGGFIKPDYTAFHHKTFYGSAYVPQALHNAALVYHLLEGTSFALDATAKRNIRKVLEVLRITAVKYSTPNSIGGRFPSYDKAILAQILPAYAYISYVHGNTDNPNPTVEDPEMFLRLAQPVDSPDVKAYLEKGQITSPIHYWKTIGSVDILDKVQQLATQPTNGNPVKQAEPSPSGHWSKNFAALSIHRRNDWSVAAKGFNKYVWDFEKSDAQNVYGVFISHGSLQISNSEAALKSYDVENGWDWTRIPGATTVNLGLDNIRTDKARYYNPGGFAGGVTLVGSDNRKRRPQNGAFGMNFKKKPDYEMKTNKASPLKKMAFQFKKSYFFYDHLIVAVGNDILLEGLDEKDKFYAQTTLFQDKLVDPSKKSTISIDGQEYDLRLLLKSLKKSTRSTVNVIDTHGNKYKVQTDANTELNIAISDQESRKSNGCPDKTKARYATAWIVHKKKKNNRAPTNSYEYAVLVNGGAPALLSKYHVKIIDNNKAHAVRFFETAPANSDGVFAYSIFQQVIDNDFGPVKSADSPCMIMAKKEANVLYLSISNPSLEFEDIDLTTANQRLRETCSGTNRKDLDGNGCVQDEKNPSNSDDVRRKMMFCVQGKKKRITVTLNCDFEQNDIQAVRVDGKVRRKIRKYARKLRQPKKVKFPRLTNGFTTEIKIMINPRSCSYVLA